MNMNKMIISLLLVLGIVSCINERSVEILETPESGKAMSYPVKFRLDGRNGGSTRATRESSATLAADANEKQINNLVVIAFNSLGKLEKVIKHNDITFDNPSDFHEGGTFDLGVAGNFRLEFVANSTDAFQNSLQLGMSLAAFGALTVSDVPSHGDDGFVMTNAEPVNVTTEIGVDKNVGNVTLRRLVARFDVFSNVDGLHIESITLKNQVSSSFIFTDNDIPANSDTEKEFTKSTTDPLWFIDTKAVAGIYSYENPTKGATTLLLKGKYTNSTSNPDWEKEVAFIDSSDNQMPIKRNHLYRVVVSESSEGDLGAGSDVTFNIEVLDWDDAVKFEYSDSEMVKQYTEYIFTATPSTFTALGGTGSVTAVRNVYDGNDNTDPLMSTTPLNPNEFTIASKGSNPEGLTVNDADKSFKVGSHYTANNYVIVATVDGTDHEITVQRASCSNPLSLVAEYNVNPAGDGFVTTLTPKGDDNGFFNFDDAVANFSNIAINSQQYHLPSQAEWRSIVPGNSNYVHFANTNSHDNISENVSVLGQDITSNSDFRTGVSGISYALRYKGTVMESAWRYQKVDADGGTNAHMIVTSRNVSGQNKTVDEIAQTDFWSTNNENDIVRYFPASGIKVGTSYYAESYGFFWSSTEANNDEGWIMRFNSEYNLAEMATVDKDNLYSVRLFVSGN